MMTSADTPKFLGETLEKTVVCGREFDKEVARKLFELNVCYLFSIFSRENVSQTDEFGR